MNTSNSQTLIIFPPISMFFSLEMSNNMTTRQMKCVGLFSWNKPKENWIRMFDFNLFWLPELKKRNKIKKWNSRGMWWWYRNLICSKSHKSIALSYCSKFGPTETPNGNTMFILERIRQNICHRNPNTQHCQNHKPL